MKKYLAKNGLYLETKFFGKNPRPSGSPPEKKIRRYNFFFWCLKWFFGTKSRFPGSQRRPTVVDSDFILFQWNFEKSEMSTRISRAVVGRSGPYFTLLKTHMGLQKYEVWARSAYYSPRKTQNTSKIRGGPRAPPLPWEFGNFKEISSFWHLSKGVPVWTRYGPGLYQDDILSMFLVVLVDFKTFYYSPGP